MFGLSCICGICRSSCLPPDRSHGLLTPFSALSSMVSRPFIIDRSTCGVVMPTLTLEYTRDRPDQPSPFRHMNLHCQLCIDLAAELGSPVKPDEDKAMAVKRAKEVVERWIESLPAEYAVKNPDTRWDHEFDWVVFQRRYLHLIAYMSLFGQLKPFLTLSSAEPMSELEASLRAAGVDAALGLMEVSWRLFENLVSVGAKFHYAVFCIFDAATVMCAAFTHDEARNLPKRETILEAIKKSLGMLAEVARQSKTTAQLFRHLRSCLAKLPLHGRELDLIGSTKRIKGGRVTPPADRAFAIAKSTTSSYRQGPHSEVQQDFNPRHRSTSASSDSNSTLDSSNSRLHSESPTSVPESGQSVASQSSSSSPPPAQEPARPRAVLPSNAVASTDHYLESSAFALPTPAQPAYQVSMGSFMPPTSAMSTTVYVPSNGFQAASYVQGGDFSYGPAGPLPYNQPVWQSTQGATDHLSSGLQVYQDVGLSYNEVPELLHYWNWRQLGLGDPASWSQIQAQAGIRQQQAGFPDDFSVSGMTNDCAASSSTEDMSRRDF